MLRQQAVSSQNVDGSSGEYDERPSALLSYSELALRHYT